MAKPSRARKSAAKTVVTKAAVEEKAVVKEAPVVEETPVVEEKAVEKKPARKPACKTSVCVEMADVSANIADVQTAVKKAVKELGLEAKELKIYINAQEQAAYFTVDGAGSEEYKVDLKAL